MTQHKKINIRIKFNNASKVAIQETGYIYHWHRIIITTILLTSIILGCGYLVSTNSNKQINTANLIATKSVTVPLQTSSETQSVKKNNLDTNQLAVKKQNTIPSPVRATLSPNQTIDKTTNIPEVLAPIFTHNKTQIFSDQIKKFVLAQSVNNKTPRGDIEKITFDKNNIATVYAFSLVTELVDKTIYYNWQLNGKQIVRVKINIGSDHWRSYSSKFIQPSMHGNWRVTLENKKGKILAVSEFHY